MRYLSIIAFILLLGPAMALGQELTASLSHSEIPAGERFKLTFSFNSSGSSFSPPDLQKFIILSGPNQSSNMQFINGKMSSSISFSYVLSGTVVGEYTIGSASITSNGKVFKSNPVKIKITRGSTKKQGATSKQTQQSSPDDLLKNNLFMKLLIDKKNLHQGEQLIATYKLYFNINIVENTINELPSFNGFWTEDVNLPSQVQTRTEMLNGKQYKTAVLKKVILFPQHSGEVEIPALSLNMTAQVPDTRRRQRGFFDQFFGAYKNVKTTVTSNTASVNVKPLPSDKPDGYGGAVGNFSMAAEMDKGQVSTNEAINFTITYSGKGNLRLLEAPEINFPSDFEVYEPKVKDQIQVTASGVSGKRTFEYLVIPRHSGEYTIDPITLSYFDLGSKSFKTIKSGEFKIDVKQGKEDNEFSYRPKTKEDVRLIGKDIRFIKSGELVLLEQGNFFFGSLPFYLLLFAPFVLLGIFLLAMRKYKAYASDRIGLRKRKANRVASKHLATARQHLKQNEKIEFYEAVSKALYGYLGDKLNIPISELSRTNIETTLISRDVPTTTVVELIQTLDTCEMARFAPASDASEQKVYDEAANIINQIEKALK